MRLHSNCQSGLQSSEGLAGLQDLYIKLTYMPVRRQLQFLSVSVSSPGWDSQVEL